MDSSNIVGTIELGNVNLKCLIIMFNENGTKEILSSSVIKSEGIQNGQVVNLTKATNSIRLCISAAEKKAKVLLKRLVLF